MVASSVAQSRFSESMRWRCIGPHRGGRVVAVAGDPLEPMTFYFGACGGGVWKTEDGGVYWQNVSDGHFTSAAVGAIAVADSDTVQLQLKDETSQAVMKPVGSESCDYTYVIMPMRV